MLIDMMATVKPPKPPVDPDVRLLAAAADPTRIEILRQLASGDGVCACDFTGCCGVSQPTVSHHLKVLREAGWVRSERRGTWVYYFLLPEAVERFQRLGAALATSGSSFPLPSPRRLPVVQPS
jgi:ArsR family transcriptional regulator, arsenate/arsenite/antimonite-responsive transcriptional repressor